MKKLLLISIIFVLTTPVFSQSNKHIESMIAKIDSISKALEIKEAVVYAYQVGNSFELTDTQSVTLGQGEFLFDAPFLIIESKERTIYGIEEKTRYLNMDKLLYFDVNKDKLVFYFHRY